MGVTTLDLTEYRGWLQRGGRRPATVNRRLAALKAAFAWAAKEGIVPANPAAPVWNVPEQRVGPRALDRRAVSRLLAEAQTARAIRDLALITLLAQTGLRIGEALSLTWGDVTLRERSGFVTVRHGKGGKFREVPLTLTARRALETWCDEHWPEGAAGADPVFPGRRPGRPLTARAAQQTFSRYARRAGIDGRATPHALRHTFCKNLVDAGVSLDRVAALAGHASLNTTARYTRPTHADLEREVKKLEWM